MMLEYAAISSREMPKINLGDCGDPKTVSVIEIDCSPLWFWFLT
jgi:hypothetical protein